MHLFDVHWSACNREGAMLGWIPGPESELLLGEEKGGHFFSYFFLGSSWRI